MGFRAQRCVWRCQSLASFVPSMRVWLRNRNNQDLLAQLRSGHFRRLTASTPSSTSRRTQSVANVMRPDTLWNTGCKNAPQQQHNDFASSVQLTRRSPSSCRSHTSWSCVHGKLSGDTGVAHSNSSRSSSSITYTLLYCCTAIAAEHYSPIQMGLYCFYISNRFLHDNWVKIVYIVSCVILCVKWREQYRDWGCNVEDVLCIRRRKVGTEGDCKLQWTVRGTEKRSRRRDNWALGCRDMEQRLVVTAY